MNRLEAMNICQATRYGSRSFWLF